MAIRQVYVYNFKIIAKQDSRFIADVKLTREKANKA